MKICKKYENKWKRRGKSVLPELEDKNPWKFLTENDKNLALNFDQSKRERKNFWKSLNSDRTREKLMILKNSERFSIDWKTNSINRKLHSIDPEPIEPSRFKTNFYS